MEGVQLYCKSYEKRKSEIIAYIDEVNKQEFNSHVFLRALDWHKYNKIKICTEQYYNIK